MTLEFFNEKFTLILKHGKFFCLSLFCNFLRTLFFNNDIQITNKLLMQFKIIQYKFNNYQSMNPYYSFIVRLIYSISYTNHINIISIGNNFLLRRNTVFENPRFCFSTVRDHPYAPL